MMSSLSLFVTGRWIRIHKIQVYQTERERIVGLEPNTWYPITLDNRCTHKFGQWPDMYLEFGKKHGKLVWVAAGAQVHLQDDLGWNVSLISITEVHWLDIWAIWWWWIWACQQLIQELVKIVKTALEEDSSTLGGVEDRLLSLPQPTCCLQNTWNFHLNPHFHPKES